MEEIKLTGEMKNKAQQLLLALGQTKMRFESYLEGCKDGLGLEGDWNINTHTWVFSKVEPPKKEGE